LIRELHTYGRVQPCKENNKYYKNNNILLDENDNVKTQHKGFGKKLLKRAEEIAFKNGYKKIAVIAGVGVREYYRSNGYNIDSKKGCYQIMNLNPDNYKSKTLSIKYSIGVLFLLFILIIFLYSFF
jgi:histone acetyltransferase (RNA polymerase elongator complex component)